METKLTLSDKIIEAGDVPIYVEVIEVEDIKQFIKELKKELPNELRWELNNEVFLIHKIIDKLLGDELTNDRL